MWFLLRDELIHWKDGRVRRFSGPRPPGENNFNSFEFGAEGEFWLRARNGQAAVRFHNGHWFEFDPASGLADADVRRCIVDREGGVWVGTGSGGVQLLQPKRVELPLSFAGTYKGEVHSVTSNSAGSVALGASSGLWVFRDDKWSRLSNSQTNDAAVLRLGASPVLYRRDGTLLAGIHDTGLFRATDDRFIRVEAADVGPIRNWHPNSLFEDTSGRLWIGSGHGLLMENGARFDRLTTEQGLFSNVATAVIEASDGAIWIGSNGEGVTRWKDGRLQALTRKDGLTGKSANPILAEPDGTIWISCDAGLNRWRNGQFRLLSANHGLPDHFTYSLIPDGRGNYWAHCNRGIWRVRCEDLNAVADGRTNRFEPVLYGEADGMMSAEGNGDEFPSSCRSGDGRLWFANTRGVVMINPATLLENDVPPPVVIEQVIADYEVVLGDSDPVSDEQPLVPHQWLSPVTATRPARFMAGRARILEIHYTANSFVDPGKVRFRFRLVGRDDTWRFDNANRRAAFYTDLRPGNYTLRGHRLRFLKSSENGHFPLIVSYLTTQVSRCQKRSL